MYTHKKKTYHARCLQWIDGNTEEIMWTLREHNIGAAQRDGSLMLRWTDTKGTYRIDMFRLGMWIRIGENGEMKLMTDDEFKLKYESIRHNELRQDAAVIMFALASDDPLELLDLWMHGDFDAIRADWPEFPVHLLTHDVIQ